MCTNSQNVENVFFRLNFIFPKRKVNTFRRQSKISKNIILISSTIKWRTFCSDTFLVEPRIGFRRPREAYLWIASQAISSNKKQSPNATYSRYSFETKLSILLTKNGTRFGIALMSRCWPSKRRFSVEKLNSLTDNTKTCPVKIIYALHSR